MNKTVNASSKSKFSPADRELYFKISLSESEMKVYDHKIKRISEIFKENGAVLNIPEFYRILLLNLDGSDLLNVMLKLYLNDVPSIFKITKDSNV